MKIMFLFSLTILWLIVYASFAQSTCPVKENQPKFAGIWGEFLLVGFVPIHRPNGTYGCSEELRDSETIELVESLLYAVDVFNNNSGPWEMEKPSISGKLGIIIFDTCQNALRTSWLLSSWLNGQFHYEDSQGRYFDPTKVVGIVGPLYSSICMEVAKIAAKENLIEVSYSSSAMEMFNYPTFFRTIPADDLQTQAIMDLLLQLKAEAVSILYRDDKYGRNGFKIIKEKAREAQICLDKMIEIPFNLAILEDNIGTYLRTLDKSPSRIVILFVGWEQAEVIMKHASHYNNSFIWIGTHPWGNREIFLGKAMMPQVLGSYIINVEQTDRSEVLEYIQTLRPKDNHRNVFFNESFEQYVKCSLGNSKNEKPCTDSHVLVTKPDPKVDLELKAVWAIALALSDTVEDICGDVVNCKEIRTKQGVKKIMDATKKTSLIKSNGEQRRILRPRGDGNIAEVILNIQLNETTRMPYYQEVGRFNGTLEITGNLKTYNSARNVTKTLKSYCTDCECPFKNKTDPLLKLNNTIFKKGDIYLIGMIPIHSSIHNNTISLRGTIEVETIKAAVDHVNNEIFRGDVKLGYMLFDTYSNTDVATWHMIGLNQLGRYFGLTQYNVNKDRIIGLLLKSQGADTKPVIDIANAQGILQMDYGSRISALETSKNYYFPLKHSMETELKALVDLILYFNWKYISVVWSDSITSKLAFAEVKRLLNKSDICVVSDYSVGGPMATNVVAANMDAIKADIVLVLIEDDHTPEFIDAIDKLDSNYWPTFIGWNRFITSIKELKTTQNKYVNATLGLAEEDLDLNDHVRSILNELQNISSETYSNKDLLKHSIRNDINRITTVIHTISKVYHMWRKNECGQSPLDRQCLNGILQKRNLQEGWYDVLKEYAKDIHQQTTVFKIQSYIAPDQMFTPCKTITIGKYKFTDGNGHIQINNDELGKSYFDLGGKRCPGNCDKCQGTTEEKRSFVVPLLASITVVSLVIHSIMISAFLIKQKASRHEEYSNTDDLNLQVDSPKLPPREQRGLYAMNLSNKDVKDGRGTLNIAFENDYTL